MTWKDSVIAIIERDPSLRRVLGRLLRSADYFVVAFPSLDALIASPLRADVDCLVVDVEGSGLTARALERRLAGHSWPTPFILLGGSAAASAQRRAHSERPAAQLSMPFDAQELLCRIRIELAQRDLDDPQTAESRWPHHVAKPRPCTC